MKFTIQTWNGSWRYEIEDDEGVILRIGNMDTLSKSLAICGTYGGEAKMPEACPACGTLLTESIHDPTCPLFPPRPNSAA